jgi:hypothetical protein
MVIWNGREWQDVGLGSLTKVVAQIVIDYRHDDGDKFARWCRLTYGLEDDGSRGVSKTHMHADNMISGVSGIFSGSPAIPDLDDKGIREAEEIVKTLPPSTGGDLTNGMVRITDSGDPSVSRAYIRTYPCAAVPQKVMRLLDLMGGFRYEAKEILKPEASGTERERTP